MRFAKVKTHRKVIEEKGCLYPNRKKIMSVKKNKQTATVFIPSAKILEQVPLRSELYGVRDELKSETRAIGLKLDQSQNELRAEIKAVDERLTTVRDELRAEIKAVDERLTTVRDELRAEIKAVDARLTTVRDELRAEIKAVDERLTTVRDELLSEIRTLDHRMNALELKMEQFKTEIRFELKFGLEQFHSTASRILTLLEEQRSDNRLVLEGHQLLWQKMSEIDQRFKN